MPPFLRRTRTKTAGSAQRKERFIIYFARIGSDRVLATLGCFCNLGTMAERRKLETILMSDGLVSEEQLKQIVRYAHAVGIDLYEAVLQKKIVHPDAVMMAYAESVGLPFINLAETTIDEEVAAQIDPMTARQYSIIPISIDQGYVRLAATKPIVPDVADELRMIFDLPVRCVICTPAELGDAIAKYYPRGAVRVVKTEQENTPTSPSKPAPQKSEPAEPMNEAEIKDRFLKTIITFNSTLAFVYFALYYSPATRWIGDHFATLLSIGTLIGGIAAAVVWRMLSR